MQYEDLLYVPPRNYIHISVCALCSQWIYCPPQLVANIVAEMCGSYWLALIFQTSHVIGEVSTWVMYWSYINFIWPLIWSFGQINVTLSIVLLNAGWMAQTW